MQKCLTPKFDANNLGELMKKILLLLFFTIVGSSLFSEEKTFNLFFDADELELASYSSTEDYEIYSYQNSRNNLELNSELKTQILLYIKFMISTGNADRNNLYIWKIPIIKEASKLCDAIQSFLDDGGDLLIFTGWYERIISFDLKNKQIILTDSER